MQPQQKTDAEYALDDGAVRRFLSANPDFFNQHEDILPRLHIPHVSGRAISLVERQVSALRGRCASLEHSLRDLIGVARANEELQGRLHGLIREIVSADTLDVVLDATRRSLCENFGADEVHVLLFEGPDDARLAGFRALLESGGTRCGMPDDAQLAALVGDARAGVGSAALIPLLHEDALGVVMLSSRDESSFGAGKGVMFLDQLGEVLSRRVHTLGRASS